MLVAARGHRGYEGTEMLAVFLSQPVVWFTSIGEAIATVLAFVGVGTLIHVAVAHVRSLQCHEHGCWRLGRFPHEPYRFCHRHHSEVPDDGRIHSRDL